MQLPALYPILASLIAITSARPPLEFPDNPSPPGVDTWCAAFPDLVEAGWTHPPSPPDAGRARLELRCWARYKPVIADGRTRTGLLVDARVTYGADFPLRNVPKLENVLVTVTTKVGSDILVKEYPVVISTDEDSAVEVPIEISGLHPRREEYELVCTASLPESTAREWKQRLEIPEPAHADLFCLPPNPYGGTTVILDQKTDELLVEGLPEGSKLPSRLFPVGWYTNWGDYLSQDYSILGKMKEAGFTLVHPVPGGGPATDSWHPFTLQDFTTLLSAAESAGIYVMYDTRHTYLSSADLSAQITLFRSYPSLLLWYSSDEPDGAGHFSSSPGASTKSTVEAYELINALDGYHPVSLTPNCANYFLPQYAAGADIIIPDVYPIGLHTATFSPVYNTPCNRTYGCCGCDLCHGVVDDVGRRMQSLKDILRWKGMRRSFWGVVQAFGGEGEFWERLPTKKEIVDMGRQVLDFGGRGVLFWDVNGRKGEGWKEVWEGAREVARLGEEEREGREKVSKEEREDRRDVRQSMAAKDEL